MLVKCRCGQEFSTYEARFPHRVSCHMCGVKFMVLEDGSTDEIRAITVCVTCRCGRPHTISALQFPRTIYCVDCHHRFSVFDTGEIIDCDYELNDAATLDANAIQANGPSEWKASADAAIKEVVSDETRIRPRIETDEIEIRRGLDTPTNDEAFARRLAAFDSQWLEHRLRFLVTLYWHQFYPTRIVCVGLFAAYVPLAAAGTALLIALFQIPTSAVWWILLIVVNGSLYFFAHLYQRAALYEAAERRWQMERNAMLREHQAVKGRLIDSDENVC